VVASVTDLLKSAYGPSSPGIAPATVSAKFVLMSPGSITTTCTPKSLTSYRMASDSASTACLVAW
jgi:hypothetical protein